MQEMQTALKEQDRSWQKKMNKLSTSCKDKLTDVRMYVVDLKQSCHR